MSRCFPFPPPGYEKRTTSDDADLITKEKRKEKRRKKDKKNKDRREGKEKKDEERSKEKSREKKDRKEKKKDKKEKNKDREKNRTLDEKRIEGKPASDNGVEIDDSRIVQELGQRLGDESKVAGIRTFQKFTLTDNGNKNEVGKVNGQGNKVKARSPENAAIHNQGWMDRRRIEQSSISSTLSEEKWKTIDISDATSHNWGWVDQRRVVQSNIGEWAEEKGKSNDKNDTGMANGRGNKVEARAPENRAVFNSPWSDQRRTEQNWGEEKGKTKDRDDARKANGRGPETAAVHTSVWMDQRRIEGMQVKEEDVEKKVEVKDNDEHNGRDKKKNKDREKKSKSKDKRRDKKKEQKEKMKGRREKDTKEESKFKGSSQSSIDTQNLKPETLLKENRESIATSGNLGKRKKELEANGRFHENRMQPNKLPRSIPSSGLKSESEKPGFPFDQKADIKINGSAETRFSNSASTSSSSASVQTIEKCEEEASARLLPHPDTKFLSQILSIPKLEECPDLDDQEWLFSHKNLLSKKMETETASSGSDGTMQVWAEALPLKSADLSALPYVIPF